MSRRRGRKVTCACGRSTQSHSGICLWCQRAARSDEVRRCETCERNAVAGSAYCRPCRLNLSKLTEEDILRDGEWVQRGLIQVWEPSPHPAPPRVTEILPWRHGTESGYQRHRRHRDNWPLPAGDPCGCRAAHAAHEALRVAMKERPDMKAAS